MGHRTFGVSRLLVSISAGLALVLCTGSAFAQAGWIATDLGTLGGTSDAYGINDAGHVVGSSYKRYSNHAFVWTAAKGMQDLDDFSYSSYSSEARAITDVGQIGGWCLDPPYKHPHACMWTLNGGKRDLGTLGSTHSYAYGINNAGQVVGFSANRAFLWTAATGMQDLGTLGGSFSVAYGINDAGQAVGVSRPIAGGEYAVVWSGPWKDLAIDFGPDVGLWTAHQLGIWRPVHDVSPDGTVSGDLDGNGLDDLVVDFGAYGFFVWMNHTTWTFLHAANPTQMITGDLDNNGQDDIVCDFPGFGLWRFNNNSVWAPLHGLSAARLAVGNLDGTGGDELLVSFAGAGLWRYGDASGWTFVHSADATQLLTADLDHNGADDVVVAFVGAGSL